MVSCDIGVLRHEDKRAHVSVRRRGQVLDGKNGGDILFEVHGAELSRTNRYMRGSMCHRVEELSLYDTQDSSVPCDIWMEEELMIHEWRKGLM